MIDMQKCEEIERKNKIKFYTSFVYLIHFSFPQSTSPEPDQSKKSPTTPPAVTPPTSPPQEDKSLLQRWFPGWGGWYGGQAGYQATTAGAAGSAGSQGESGTRDTVGEPPPAKISKSELGTFKTF